MFLNLFFFIKLLGLQAARVSINTCTCRSVSGMMYLQTDMSKLLTVGCVVRWLSSSVFKTISNWSTNFQSRSWTTLPTW